MPCASRTSRDRAAAAAFAAAERGDALAERILAEVLDHVAMTVVDVIAVQDPERVVLDGSVGRALRPYLSELTEIVAASVLYVPELFVSTLAPSPALVGAVAEAHRRASMVHRPSSGAAPAPLVDRVRTTSTPQRDMTVAPGFDQGRDVS